MNIQKRIKEHGFTISEVAAKLKNSRGGIGISQGSLSTILSGNPTIGKLKEIADIIGCSLSELVSSEKDKEFVSFFRYNGIHYVADNIDEFLKQVDELKAKV